MRTSVSISLPEKLSKDINKITKENHLTRSQLVKAALEEYLFKYRFKRIRDRLVINYNERETCNCFLRKLKTSFSFVTFLFFIVFSLAACGGSGSGGSGSVDDTYSVSDTGSGPTLQWTVQPGTSDLDYGNSIAVDSSGNVYATGLTGGGLDGNAYKGDRDIFITKYDTNGSRLWTVQPGTSDLDCGTGIAVDSDGNAYATGKTYGGLDGNTNDGIFITKYDANGSHLWTVQPGTSWFGGGDGGNGIAVDSSGSVYAIGYTLLVSPSGNPNYDIFITKYDTNGNHLWTVQPGTSSDDSGTGIAVDSSGNVYATGSTYGGLDGNINNGWADIFITKYDTNGSRLWTVQPGTSDLYSGAGIAVDSSGNVYATGGTYGDLDGNSSNGSTDIFITKYDTNGSRLWTVQPGTSSSDWGNGIAIDSSGNLYATGRTEGGLDGNTSNGGYDIFITKYDNP